MDKAALRQAGQMWMTRQAAAVADEPASPPSVMLDTRTRVDTRSAGEVQRDSALEYDSMVFLATAEQLAMRLSEPMMQASPLLALEYLIKLTNQLVEFTAQLPLASAKKFTLETLLSRDRKNYSQLGLKHVRDGRLALEAFEALHVRQGGMRHPNTFQQLCRDLLRVMNICLNICVKAFSAPETRQQWRTVYSGFLVNLARAIQRLYTPLSNGRGA
ncbi:MAG: hypothetical protein AB7N91_24565 [Candidatus Tectimicrobiota bacterium]